MMPENNKRNTKMVTREEIGVEGRVHITIKATGIKSIFYSYESWRRWKTRKEAKFSQKS